VITLRLPRQGIPAGQVTGIRERWAINRQTAAATAMRDELRNQTRRTGSPVSNKQVTRLAGTRRDEVTLSAWFGISGGLGLIVRVNRHGSAGAFVTSREELTRIDSQSSGGVNVRFPALPKQAAP
jgi:hypothetical protein